MRSILACSLIAVAICGATPVFAQGLYVGPDGVGIDTGRHYRDYDRDRDGYRPYRDEGRSIYRERRHHDDDDDE